MMLHSVAKSVDPAQRALSPLERLPAASSPTLLVSKPTKSTCPRNIATLRVPERSSTSAWAMDRCNEQKYQPFEPSNFIQHANSNPIP
jgi:hypothetical protein